jgi:hypothetical protein
VNGWQEVPGSVKFAGAARSSSEHGVAETVSGFVIDPENGTDWDFAVTRCGSLLPQRPLRNAAKPRGTKRTNPSKFL